MLPKVQISGKNAFICLTDLIGGLIIASIWWPIGIVLYVLNKTLRFLVQRSLNFHYGFGKYRITNGEDGVFGYRVKGNCNSMIQGWQIIKGEPNLQLIREKFQNMLDERGEEYDRLKYTFANKWGYYCWEKDDKFNLRNHIRLLDNWDWTKEGDERKLLELTGEMATKDMTPNKPQWEVLLVPKYHWEEGKQGEKFYALVTRFSHAYSDAISYFLMVNNYIADSTSGLPMDPTKPFKVPLWMELIVWAKVFLLGPYYFVHIVITYFLDRSVFSFPEYSPTKMNARSPSIPLEVVRQIKQKSGASVTSILYTALYSALEKSHRRVHPDVQVPPVLHLGSVMAMFPYWKERKLGNQFTLWPYAAPLSVPEGLVQRLHISSDISMTGVGSPGPVFNFHLTKALGSLPSMLHFLFWQLNGCPVMLSNVPGFTTPLKIYGGEMVDGAGFIPLMSVIGIGLSTQTYCGKLRFNCVADPKAFRRRSSMQQFLDEIISELSSLAEIYEVSLEAKTSIQNHLQVDSLRPDPIAFENDDSCDGDDEDEDEEDPIDENGNEVTGEIKDFNKNDLKSEDFSEDFAPTVNNVEKNTWLIGKCIQSI